MSLTHSGRSSGRTAWRTRKPCLTAFLAEILLPVGVRGPWLLAPLRRLAF